MKPYSVTPTQRHGGAYWLAVKRPAGHDVQYVSALALAYAGDDRQAQALTAGLANGFPEATIVQYNYLPTLRAKRALSNGNASEALDSLRAAATYELGQSTYSIYPLYSLVSRICARRSLSCRA